MLLVLAVVAGITTGFLAWRHFQKKTFAWTTVETRTLTILRSENLAFLATDRLVTQIVVSSREYNLILGQREGYLVATVRLYYGIDVATVTPANLRREAGRLTVMVPEPRELDFAVDVGSLRFISKRNVTVAIRDWLQGQNLEDDLRKRLKGEALAFMATQQLIPARSTIVARLNGWAPVLTDNLGVEVRFE
jgi:hypothetical protein